MLTRFSRTKLSHTCTLGKQRPRVGRILNSGTKNVTMASSVRTIHVVHGRGANNILITARQLPRRCLRHPTCDNRIRQNPKTRAIPVVSTMAHSITSQLAIRHYSMTLARSFATRESISTNPGFPLVHLRGMHAEKRYIGGERVIASVHDKVQSSCLVIGGNCIARLNASSSCNG